MTNMIYTAMPALPKKHHTNAVVLPSEWNTCPLSSIVEEISETVGTRKIETISISAGIGFVNQAEKFGRELSGKQYERDHPLGCMGTDVTAAKCCASLIKSKQRVFQLVIVSFLLFLFKKEKSAFLFLS